jgi:hypothetical protein
MVDGYLGKMDGMERQLGKHGQTFGNLGGRPCSTRCAWFLSPFCRHGVNGGVFKPLCFIQRSCYLHSVIGRTITCHESSGRLLL